MKSWTHSMFSLKTFSVNKHDHYLKKTDLTELEKQNIGNSRNAEGQLNSVEKLDISCFSNLLRIDTK
jgi:hypothetical protein